MTKTVKNLIFDVGNVLLEYRWHEMIMEYGLSNEEAMEVENTVLNMGIWDVMDMGNMSTAEIIEVYSQKYPQYEGLLKWFLTHGDQMHIKREDVWKKVHQLKEKGYHIYLLSNYSQELFEEHTKDASFMQDIDGKVVSYQIHIGKPDARIYEYLLDTYQLKAEECVFFDDKPDNTRAAEKLGIRSYTITSRAYLLEVLDTF